MSYQLHQNIVDKKAGIDLRNGGNKIESLLYIHCLYISLTPASD